MSETDTERLKCPPENHLAMEEDPYMLTYAEIYQRCQDASWARKKIYDYSLNHSISQTAKEFSCHINTVKKIRKRGKVGEFSKRSRAPNHSPNKLDQKVIEHIYSARKDKGMGHHNLKHQYNIPAAASTIYKYLKKKKGCIKPRKKKWKHTRDLRTIKQQYKAFEHIQMDGKVLYDIPQFYGFYKTLGIPKLQFTMTCQKTGASFIAYSNGETMTEACTFVVYFLEHLKKFGINTKRIVFRTDLGSFAIGSIRSFKISNFTSLIHKVYGAKHRTNQHKNQNADVERFHGLVEEYFYKRVKPVSINDFFNKASEAQIWFNYIRKNGGKNWKTPLEILKQDYPHIDPQVLTLPPIYLNKCTDLYFFKIDPSYKPLSKTSFFIDMAPVRRNMFFSNSAKDDLQYFSGDASKSSYVDKQKFPKRRTFSYV
jgi:transposase